MSDLVLRIAKIARDYPRQLAVDVDGEHVDYASFWELARRYQTFFEERSPSCRVLVALPQGVDAYAAIIGAMSAGGTFCPVDPDMPPGRRLETAALFRPDVVVSLSSEARTGYDVCTPAEARSHRPAQSPQSPAETAYVIFTSGSTGSPNGVMVPTDALSPFCDWLSDTFAPSPRDRWAQFSQLSFDLSLVDLLGALTNGATLVPVRRPLDRLFTGRFVDRCGITVWHSVPSLIPTLMEGATLSTLRIASFCGEPMYTYYVDRLFASSPSIRILNTYGPTEGTLFCTWEELRQPTYARACRTTAPIGAPIPGWFLLRNPAGNGGADETFELVIAGDFIATGYVGGTAVDAARFGEVDLGGETVRCFHTGDFIRDIGGRLYFDHRRDRQVKIRGHRVELGEIESAILKIGALEAHCFVSANRIAVAVRWSGPSLSRSMLRERLTPMLAEHAIPSDVLTVSEFPRLPSGKIDYGRLRDLTSEVAPA